MEDKTIQVTERNSENQHSPIDVTSQLSPVSLFAWFCTPPELKFHVFRRLKHREEKLISKKVFLIFLSDHHIDSIQQIKKNLSYIYIYLVQLPYGDLRKTVSGREI